VDIDLEKLRISQDSESKEEVFEEVDWAMRKKHEQESNNPLMTIGREIINDMNKSLQTQLGQLEDQIEIWVRDETWRRTSFDRVDYLGPQLELAKHISKKLSAGNNNLNTMQQLPSNID